MNTQLNDSLNNQEILERAIREGRKKVDYNTLDYPLEVWLEKISQEQINNELVWDKLQQSSLIESLLLGLPFLNIIINNELEVIKGKQQLYTAINFINDNLRLENLNILTSLNGFTFNNLLLPRQRKFKKINVRTIEIAPNSDITYWVL